MVNKRLDSRQSICRDLLDQIGTSVDTQIDDSMVAINNELTMPLRLTASAIADRVVNVGNIIVTDPITYRNRTHPHIGGVVPIFTSGIITLPATTGGNITFSTIGSTPVILNCVTSAYVKVLIYLDSAGNLGAVVGDQTVNEADALVPNFVRKAHNIGYILIHNTGGTIDNITNSKIYQFVSGNTNSDIDLEGEFTIANNQVSPANIADFVLDTTKTENVIVDYSVVRKNIDDFITGFNSIVHTIAIDGSGNIVVGGHFTTYNGSPCPARLCRLLPDGTLDTTFNTGGAGFNSTVRAIAIDGSGNILVGGDFTTYNGVACPNFLCRLNSNGSLDGAFNIGGVGFNSTVRAIAIDGSGNILVGGDFTTYNGVFCPNRFCRILSTGALDIEFNYAGLGFNAPVYSIVIDGSGRFVVGGAFSTFNGGSCPRGICRLVSAGAALDSSFNSGGSGIDAEVRSIVLDGSGNIIIGGSFGTYNGNGACPNYFCKINASNGSLDTSFNYNNDGFNDWVYTIAIDANSDFIIGGKFTSYNSDSNCPDRLCKINSDGTLNTSFNYGTGTRGFSIGDVRAIVIDSNGDLIVGGGFYSLYSGQSHTPTCFCKILEAGDTFELWYLTTYYYKEIGEFYVQYDDDTAIWTIDGETFTGSDAGVDFSMSGNQLQYTSSNITGDILTSTMKYSVKYL
jgi:hypothetical protein